MKINFTKAILNIAGAIALLSTQAVNAKMGGTYLESTTAIALQTEINQNIENVLGYIKAPVVKNDIVKQMKVTALELQTNDLVRDVDQKLPKFKFKVVIAD